MPINQATLSERVFNTLHDYNPNVNANDRWEAGIDTDFCLSESNFSIVNFFLWIIGCFNIDGKDGLASKLNDFFNGKESPEHIEFFKGKTVADLAPITNNLNSLNATIFAKTNGKCSITRAIEAFNRILELKHPIPFANAGLEAPAIAPALAQLQAGFEAGAKNAQIRVAPQAIPQLPTADALEAQEEIPAGSPPAPAAPVAAAPAVSPIRNEGPMAVYVANFGDAVIQEHGEENLIAIYNMDSSRPLFIRLQEIFPEVEMLSLRQAQSESFINGSRPAIIEEYAALKYQILRLVKNRQEKIARKNAPVLQSLRAVLVNPDKRERLLAAVFPDFRASISCEESLERGFMEIPQEFHEMVRIQARRDGTVRSYTPRFTAINALFRELQAST